MRSVFRSRRRFASHRVQIFGWTVAPGGVFFPHVPDQLIKPASPITLLGLMRMNSGACIGIYFSQQR